LDGKVDPETITSRRDRLMSLQRKISRRRLARRVGKSFPAVLEGPSKESEFVWQARLEGMAPEIDGRLYITEIDVPEADLESLVGRMARVEITEANDYDLIGRVTEILDSPRAPQEPVGAEVAQSPLRVLS